MEQLGSHWTDFHEIWYLNAFRKCDKNNGCVTWRLVYVYYTSSWILLELYMFQREGSPHQHDVSKTGSGRSVVLILFKQRLIGSLLAPSFCLRKSMICQVPSNFKIQLERVCGQTQLCQLRCLMTVLDNYMFRPLLATFRLSIREFCCIIVNYYVQCGGTPLHWT